MRGPEVIVHMFVQHVSSTCLQDYLRTVPLAASRSRKRERETTVWRTSSWTLTSSAAVTEGGVCLWADTTPGEVIS
eukprot:2991048-Pyramimonas_sp.AAC.1